MVAVEVVLKTRVEVRGIVVGGKVGKWEFNEELMQNLPDSSSPYILGPFPVAPHTRLVVLTPQPTPPVPIIRRPPINHPAPHGDPLSPTSLSDVPIVLCHDSSSW